MTPIIAPAPGGRRSTWTAIAIVTGLVVVASLVIWQIGRQEAIREQEIREDVKAAFGVWQQAVARQDGDLLGALLMDGDAAWTATQRELLAAGKALDRSGIGLSLAQDAQSVLGVDADIELSRDWRSAQVSFPITYLERTRADRARPVRLEQTVPLIREGSRWLLRQAEEPFWGIWHTSAGTLAAVTFRERDAEFAQRFLQDLDRDLGERCAAATDSAFCPAETTLNVRLDSAPAALLREIDPNSPAFIGRTFILPSPTLVGKPLDEVGYQALYSAYSGPILRTFENVVRRPSQWPQQIVEVICFERYGNRPRLFQYDPVLDSWTAELGDSAFRFMTASDDDRRLALRQYVPREPNRLRIVLWSAGQASVLHDATYDSLTDHSFGWIMTTGQTRLLLAEFQGTTRQPAYYVITGLESGGESCPASGCALRQLAGFPAWSPDGRYTLAQSDQELFLADENGRAAVALGVGHNPFWLDEEHFGFIRPLATQEGQLQQLVIGSPGETELSEVWSTAALSSSMFGSTVDSPFYIQHTAVSQAPDRRVLLYGRQYAGDESRYAVLSLPLAGEEAAVAGLAIITGPARVEIVLKQPPATFPSPADPNGHVPFVVSPDGRWLTMAHLTEKGADEWTIHMVEIGRHNRKSFTTGYPGYSFNHPFLDWTKDGRWLLVVDREFIRVLAPGSGYERIVAHDQRNCSYPAWIDRRRAE